MKKEHKINLYTFKDKLSIFRIRVLNFIKEHKFLSVGIGTFILSFIIATIVFATENDKYANFILIDSPSVDVKSLNSSEEISVVNSFSTIVYDISYKLALKEGAPEISKDDTILRNVNVEAEIDKSLDARWLFDDENTVTPDGKKVTFNEYNVKLGEEHHIKLYLELKNIKNGTIIESPTITIKEITSDNNTLLKSKKLTVNSKNIKLDAKIISGMPYLQKDFAGRKIPYGIVVGIDENQIKNNNNLSLEGLYFDENINMILSSEQRIGDKISQVELDMNKYGFYDRKLNLFDKMPHYKYLYDDYSVFDSGSEITLSENNKLIEGQNIVENISPVIGLAGLKNINLKIGEKYKDYGLVNSDEKSISCPNNNTKYSCEKNIYNISGEKLNENEFTNVAGKYNEIYTYTDLVTNNVIKLNRTINVKEKQKVILDENTYELYGDETILLKINDPYKELGIIKNHNILENNGENYTIEIKKNKEIADVIDTTSIGTYEIIYIITNGENEVRLTRKVIIVDEIPKEEHISPTYSKQIITNTIYTIANGKFTEPTIKIVGEENLIKCNKDNNCTVKYYNQNNENVNLNEIKYKAGTYKLEYEYTDQNGFIITSYNTINFQKSYLLKIKNLKFSDNITKLKGTNFIMFGSYYVTVNSIRNSIDKEDIISSLSLNMQYPDGSVSEIIKSSEVVNKYLSKGTKSINLSFNKNINNELKELSENEYLAYGEDVILKSVFNYSKDGDNPMEKANVKIPFGKSNGNNNVFELQSFSSDNKDMPIYIEVNNVKISSIDDSGNLYYKVPKKNEQNEIIKDSDGLIIYEELPFSEIGKILIKYTACESSTNSDVCTNEKEYTELELKEAKEKNKMLKVNGISYTVFDVNPGTKIDLRINLKTKESMKENNINISGILNYEEETKQSNISINVTPFKAGAKVLVGKKRETAVNKDIILDNSKSNTSTWVIYPYINLPSQMIHTNIAGIDELDYIDIIVTLPKDVTYRYNEDYMLPEQKGNQLKYRLKHKKVNSWIDPIVFETNYDIGIPSGEEKVISVEIQAFKGNTKDVRPIEQRTINRKIIYQNNNEIASIQNTKFTGISINQPFNVNIELYNNLDKTINDLELITVLPFNNDNSEKKNFTGLYTIDSLPKNTMCSIDKINETTNIDKLILNDSIKFEPCEKYKENQYSGVTIIKTTNINLESSKIYKQEVIIRPKNNNNDDIYNINSFIFNKNKSDDKIKLIKIAPLKVTVIGKKIRGYVWEDFDSNGLFDENEIKISGVTFKLMDSKTNEEIETVISNENGAYEFNNLKPGNYYVVAEYNNAKYGASPIRDDIYDRSIITSFYTEENKEEPDENKDELNNEENSEKEDDSIIDKPNKKIILRSNNIEITNNTKIVDEINLGLSLRKIYNVKLKKYVNKSIVTNKLGISKINDYGNSKLAKLDVKDINNLSIKVIYTLEVENVGYFPGYINRIKDYVPIGMTFNENYEENKNWKMTDLGYLENNSISNVLINPGEKKYVNIAFDINTKEAGTFINFAEIDDEDLKILEVSEDIKRGGGINE